MKNRKILFIFGGTESEDDENLQSLPNPVVRQTAINASLAGVIKGCLESHEIDVLYGALNGVEGLMDEPLVNLTRYF